MQGQAIVLKDAARIARMWTFRCDCQPPHTRSARQSGHIYAVICLELDHTFPANCRYTYLLSCSAVLPSLRHCSLISMLQFCVLWSNTWNLCNKWLEVAPSRTYFFIMSSGCSCQAMVRKTYHASRIRKSQMHFYLFLHSSICSCCCESLIFIT